MQDRKILDELTGIFREVLNDETIVLACNMRPADFPQWDSLSHITIAVAVEGRFGIKFRSSELEALASIGEFADLIDRKQSEAGLQQSTCTDPGHIAAEVTEFLVGNFLSGSTKELRDDERLLDTVIDSNGVLELVAFLEDRFGISVADDELIAENLECIENIVAYVGKKIAAGQSVPAAG
jgi:acyl carrier protein